jgi:hypothetical protein
MVWVAAVGAGHSALASVETVPMTRQAEQPGPLRNDQADTAGGRVQQQRVAGLEG